MRGRTATTAAGAMAALCTALLAGASAAVAGTQAASDARGPAAGATWGTAQEMPGTAALNTGGNAQIKSVSCASAGNCSAGGYYTDSSGDEQAFVAGETDGIWGTAQEVTGTAALNTGGSAQIWSVSCASAGNCSAGGYYTDSSAHQQAFVASEKHGTWNTAQEVPGTAALNHGVYAQIFSVSCASAGNCSAGGYYTDSSAHQQAFIASEKRGTWGAAEEVPGTAALNQGGGAEIFSASCASARSCSAGGYYLDGSGHQQAFVVSEEHGTWGTAEEVPGTAALNQRNAAIWSVSCASPGNCGAGGDYIDGSGAYQALVVRQADGTWRTAKELPGIAALNKGGSAAIYSMSCASPGDCSAGGRYFSDNSGDTQAFVTSSENGTWSKAREVPGTAALDTGGRGTISSVSCASASRCSAGGSYADNTGHVEPFVVGETNGTWGKAEEVPGIAALNYLNAQITSVSCASAGSCSAAGWYTDSSFHLQAFIVSTTSPAAGPSGRRYPYSDMATSGAERGRHRPIRPSGSSRTTLAGQDWR